MALKHIPLERLVLSSDCGMGREGMARRHALYKMVSLVQGTNIVRKELGLPVVEAHRGRREAHAAQERVKPVARGVPGMCVARAARWRGKLRSEE